MTAETSAWESQRALIYLVRHGQTPLNAAGVLRGWLDPSLDEVGRQQARRLGAALGPRLHYSENWQLWINTMTTILTFLMVFLLQHSQNRDTRAVQLKLDELLRAINGARNEFIDLENLSEQELAKYCREFQELHLRYARLIENKDDKAEENAGTTTVSGPK